MRYTRLRRQIESGTLIGTHGTPFVGGAEKIAEAHKNRKRLCRNEGENNMDENATDGQRVKEDAEAFKLEPQSYSSEYETDMSSEDTDSEAEVPLAKRRPGTFMHAVNANASMMPPIKLSTKEQRAHDHLDLVLAQQDVHSAQPISSPRTVYPVGLLECSGPAGTNTASFERTLPDTVTKTASTPSYNDSENTSQGYMSGHLD